MSAQGRRPTRIWGPGFVLLLVTMSQAAPLAGQGDSVVEYQLDPQPTLELGGIDGSGPEEFSDVVAVVSGADGSVIIGDAGSSEVRVFDAEGEFLRRFGGFGEGPGELSGIWSLWRTGGRICVADFTDAVQCFSDEGDFLESYRTLVSEQGGRVEWVGGFPSGSMVGTSLDPTRQVRVGSEIRQVRTVVRTQGPRSLELSVLGTGPGRSTSAASGGATWPSIVFSPELEVAVLEDRVCFGNTGTGEVRCVDEDGAEIATFVAGTPSRSVASADREAYFGGLAEANPDCTRTVMT